MAVLVGPRAHHPLEQRLRGLAYAPGRERPAHWRQVYLPYGSPGFDFGGVYDDVKAHERIAYTMDDGRKVDVRFSGQGNETRVVETFEAEEMNPIEMQRGGWQAILDNFKQYAESH